MMKRITPIQMGALFVVALVLVYKFVGLGDVVRIFYPEFGVWHTKVGPLPGDVVTYSPSLFEHPNTVPTGEEGEPFHISEIQGDGWTMLDSGPGFINPGYNEFHWIDENRVVFTGINTAAGAKASKVLPGRNFSGLYVWDLKENRIYRRNDLPRFDGYCARNGYVGFVLERKDDHNSRVAYFKRLYGLWGQEKIEEIRMRFDHRSLDQICRMAHQPRELYEKISTIPLMPRHGYLAIGVWGGERKYSTEYKKMVPKPDKETMNWRLYNREKGLDLELPFNRFHAISIKYFKFKNAYLIKRETGFAPEAIQVWQKTNCWPIWWMYPDGATEKQCVPTGPWVEDEAFRGMPTQGGLVIFSKNPVETKDGTPKRGIYLSKEKNIEKIMTGWADMGASYNMSPDGCKIAFGFSPTHKAARSGPATVRILNMCTDHADKVRD